MNSEGVISIINDKTAESVGAEAMSQSPISLLMALFGIRKKVNCEWHVESKGKKYE